MTQSTVKKLKWCDGHRDFGAGACEQSCTDADAGSVYASLVKAGIKWKL